MPVVGALIQGLLLSFSADIYDKNKSMKAVLNKPSCFFVLFFLCLRLFFRRFPFSFFSQLVVFLFDLKVLLLQLY